MMLIVFVVPLTQQVTGKVKVRTLDIAPLRKTSSQKRSGIASVLKGSHSNLPAHPHDQSAIGMSRTCLCLPSYSWYSFTDPGRMEGSAGLGGWLRSERVYLSEGSYPSHC